MTALTIKTVLSLNVKHLIKHGIYLTLMPSGTVNLYVLTSLAHTHNKM